MMDMRENIDSDIEHIIPLPQNETLQGAEWMLVCYSTTNHKRHSSRVDDRSPRQRFEQYLTSSQQSAHFLRHSKGRLQTTQTLLGRFDLEYFFIEVFFFGASFPAVVLFFRSLRGVATSMFSNF